ncbi:MAG TPA: Hpt domain-containing protein [Candidatus Onthocola gallistercoris]|uniref:Hpt domain-containing protein n=1 Tax=Candidatus Onthocola gallistercoris TaxID=2840876 RepID=A0A9D1KVM6_9FIRM|nr:Hpt domain-containing protein [Candidatus Onthocola gallistercoris]
MSFLEEICLQADIDYKECMMRLGNNEMLVKRFLKKFLEDRSYEELEKAWQAQDVDGVVRHAHTLKGVSANLGMKKLTAACDGLVKAGRQGGLDKNCYQEVGVQYRKICDSVAEL